MTLTPRAKHSKASLLNKRFNEAVFGPQNVCQLMISQYYGTMSLTKQDLDAIKGLIDNSINERIPKIINEQVPAIIDESVPKIVQPILDRLEKRLTVKIDQVTLDVGQFSLETTSNFMVLNAHIDDLDDGLAKVVEMADTNRVEIRKIKHKLGLS